MGWFKRKKESDYLKRQLYLMSNLGLFYLIIIALFGVPLLATFVVVLIKGVIDLRIVIVPAAMLALCLILVWGFRGLRRLIQRIRSQGREAMAAAGRENRAGQAVQISVFNGLFSLTLGNVKSPTGLLDQPTENYLPEPPQQEANIERDIVRQLKDLVDLRNAGEINDQEFELLKEHLIDKSFRPDKEPQKPH